MPKDPHHNSANGDGKKTTRGSARSGVTGAKAVKGVRKVAQSKKSVKKA
jgi:hypothetical protein